MVRSFGPGISHQDRSKSMICLSVVVNMGREKSIGGHWQTGGFGSGLRTVHATIGAVAHLRSSRDIASPVEDVWNLISRFEHWPSWGVTVTAVEPSAGQVRAGLTGRVKTVAGPWLPFEITDVVAGESWDWKVAGVRATGHRVLPTRSGCTVTFTAPIWAPFYLPVLARALRLVERASDGL